MYACKKDEAIPVDYSNGYPVDQVDFGFGTNYIYTQDTTTITTSKRCNTEHVKIFCGEQEAKILWVREDYIAIKTPLISEGQVDMVISDGQNEKDIAKNLKVYPGGLAFEYLGVIPYQGRDHALVLNVSGQAFIRGGSSYQGTNSHGVAEYVRYTDMWQYDPTTNVWAEVLALPDMVPDARKSFWDASARFKYQGVYLKSNIHYNSEAEGWTSLVFSKYSVQNEVWEVDDAYQLDSSAYLDFAFLHESSIYLGIMFYGALEIVEYDLGQKTYTSLMITDKITDHGGLINLKAAFVNWPLIYFHDYQSVIYEDDRITMDYTNKRMFQYNIEEDDFRTIYFNDSPLKNLYGGASLAFDGYSILIDGVIETASFFDYSNAYYKVTPQ